MGVAGHGEAQQLEHLHVEGDGGDPLVRADHIGGAHQVVVHHMGEMVGGQAVPLDNDGVQDILLHGQIPPDHVVVGPAHPQLPAAAHPDDPAVAVGDALQHRLLVQVPAGGPLAVVALLGGVGLLLPLPDGLQLLGGAEAGVGPADLHQILGEGLVKLPAAGLAVGSVLPAVLRLPHRALVKADLELVQRADDLGDAVFDLPLLVGVLNAEEKHPAPAPGKAAVQQGGIQPADVHEARGAGGEAGAHRPLRQISGRVQGLRLLVSHSDIGEKRVGNTFAHVKASSFS